MVRNLPCNAGYVGSNPGWGTEILHAAGQPGLWAGLDSPDSAAIWHDATKTPRAAAGI